MPPRPAWVCQMLHKLRRLRRLAFPCSPPSPFRATRNQLMHPVRRIGDVKLRTAMSKHFAEYLGGFVGERYDPVIADLIDTVEPLGGSINVDRIRQRQAGRRNDLCSIT